MNGSRLTMRRQICNAANRVALHFNIWAQHLPDERFEAAQLHDEQLVLSCTRRVASTSACTRARWVRTIYSEVPQSRTGSPLHFGVMATEEEEDGVEGVAAYGADLLLSDFGECERCAALKVDVVGKGECGQRGERRISEKVGRSPICGNEAERGKCNECNVRARGHMSRPVSTVQRTLEVLQQIGHRLPLVLQ